MRLGVLPAWREMHSDFPNYYVSSRVLAAGEDPRKLYDDAWFQERIDREGIDQAGRFSTFPPCTAFAMLPLTPFTPPTARRIWLMFNLGLLALAIVLLAQLAQIEPTTAALLVMLAGNALVSNTVLGQLYLAVTTATLAALVLAERGHPLSAGALLGACISVKYFPVIFLPALWLRGQRRAVLACLTAIAAMTGVELLVFGWQTWFQFATTVFLPHLDGRIAHQGDGHVIAYQSFNSLFRNLFERHPLENPRPLWPAPILYPLAKWATLLVIGGVGTWACLAQGTDAAGHRRRLALIGATAMVLLPVTATYHLLLFLPSLTLLLAELWRLGRRRGAGLTVALWALLGFAPFWRLAALGRDGILLPLHYPRLWLLLALWLMAVIGLWPREPAQNSDQSNSANGFSNSIAQV